MLPNDLNFSPLSVPTPTSNPGAAYLQQQQTQAPMGGLAQPGAMGQAGSGIFGGLGFNMDTLQLGLSGLGTIGNLWNAFQANKLAKEQFKFTKDITETNLANQIKSYNTALSDRSRSRAFVEGQSQETADAYVRDNSLSRR